ncbi:MAG: hypothetical protein D6715_03385 [Calditrichaeota bacterium]|nr:MAG: hypothetical protein D6715_03385 [Calditrichota bacterium]
MPDFRNLPTTAILPFDLPCYSPLSEEPAAGYFIRFRQTGPFNVLDPSITPADYGTGGDSLENPFFVFPGDPLLASGWRDDQPGDKRLAISTGPFAIDPGGSQEIIVAYLAAMGSSALNSVELLRDQVNDIRRFARRNFPVPVRPPLPQAFATHSPQSVQLHLNLEPLAEYDTRGKASGRYQFEGIQVYQLAGNLPSFSLKDSSQARLVATLDVEDPFGHLYELRNGRLQLVAEGKNNLPWQKMQDEQAFQLMLAISRDAFRSGQPLLPYARYWYAVVPYGLDLESLRPIEATPDPFDWLLESPLLLPLQNGLILSAVPGSEQAAPFRDLEARHVAGRSEGRVEISVVDRGQVQPHQYQVRFFADGTYWQLWDVTEGSVLLDSMTQQLLEDEPFFPPAAHGFALHVFGAPDYLKEVHLVEGDSLLLWFTGRQDGTLSPHALFQGGIDVLRVVNPDSFPFARHRYVPVEVRFTTSDVSRAYWWDSPDFDPQGYRGAVPTYVEAFDISDPENPRQVNVVFSSPHPRPYFGNSPNYQIIITDSDYDPDDYYHPAVRDFRQDAFLTLHLKLAPGHQEQESPVVLHIQPHFPNSDADRFAFDGSRLAPQLTLEEARQELERIRAVPNPYFLRSPYENPEEPVLLQFTHVPPGATIRIFTLAGQLIRALHPEPLSGTVGWDLTNRAGRRIAAGIYIAHISLPGTGEKILKFAVVPRK